MQEGSTVPQPPTTCQRGLASFLGTGPTPSETHKRAIQGVEAQLPCLLSQAAEQQSQSLGTTRIWNSPGMMLGR